MTSNVKFDELALKYVLAVDNEKEQHKAIAEQAAQGEFMFLASAVYK